MVGRDTICIGGLYIAPSGGVNLFSMLDDADTGQNLSDQAYTDTPTLYIPLNGRVKAFAEGARKGGLKF